MKSVLDCRKLANARRMTTLREMSDALLAQGSALCVPGLQVGIPSQAALPTQRVHVRVEYRITWAL